MRTERETLVGDARTEPIAYEFAGFPLEPARRALKQPDGTPARLSGKPFDTLVYLVEHAGELVDRDELLRAVWPKRVIEDNNLNQAIAMLRRVLGSRRRRGRPAAAAARARAHTGRMMRSRGAALGTAQSLPNRCVMFA